MIEASGVTVARHPSLRANFPNVSASVTMSATTSAMADDHAVPPSQACPSRSRRL